MNATLLLPLLFVVFLGAGIAHGEKAASPGGLKSPAMSAAPFAQVAQITLSNEGVGLTLLSFLAVVAGYHFTMRKYIREQAGVKDIQKAEIVGQPLRIAAEVEFLPMQEFKDFERYVHEREHAIRDELQALRVAIDDRRQEGAQQMEAMRDRVEEGTRSAIAASNSSASKIHGRMDALAEKQGVLVGELRQISETLRGINQLLLQGGNKS